MNHLTLLQLLYDKIHKKHFKASFKEEYQLRLDCIFDRDKVHSHQANRICYRPLCNKDLKLQNEFYIFKLTCNESCMMCST